MRVRFFLSTAKNGVVLRFPSEITTAPKGNDMLEIRGLTAGYGRLAALKSVDLEVRKDEIVFVVGH